MEVGDKGADDQNEEEWQDESAFCQLSAAVYVQAIRWSKYTGLIVVCRVATGPKVQFQVHTWSIDVAALSA